MNVCVTIWIYRTHGFVDVRVYVLFVVFNCKYIIFLQVPEYCAYTNKVITFHVSRQCFVKTQKISTV